MDRAKQQARQDYLRRINRVLDYIQGNLGGDLGLERLAEEAAFSPFHFHRIFHAMTGETVAACIRRLRLQRGAHRLRYHPGVPVTRIALDVGFGSHSSFSRAFREHFGLTPSEWANTKIGQKIDQVGSKLGTADDNHGTADSKPAISRSIHGDYDSLIKEMRSVVMNPKFEDIPARRYVYWRAVGPYGPGGEVAAVWQKAYAWAGAAGLLEGDYQLYGISHDDPVVTPPDQCRYAAAVAVDDEMEIGGLNEHRMIAGRYAVFTFRGGGMSLSDFYSAIYGEWLPRSGFVPGDGPCFERYASGQRGDPSEGFRCDICLPLSLEY
jgi:AraC family transcriptional regulator